MEMRLNIKVIGQPELEKKLLALKEAIDTRRILDQGAALLFNRMRTRFLKETDPTGEKWIPSKAALRRARSGRGGGTLYDTGKLFRSIQLYADGENSRAIGTNVTSPKGYAYGVTHQFGLYGFPVRQFLGFGDSDVKLMTDFIIKRISDGLSQ